MVQEAAFASGVPPDIYAFHHYTGNSASLYRPLVRIVLNSLSQLSQEISHPTYPTAYQLFTPSEFG